MLRTEKEAAASGFLKRNWNYYVVDTSFGKWFGGTLAGINHLIWLTGALVVLFVLSFVWKYLIRPMIKNFTPEPKPKEPQSTPTAAIN